MDRKRTNPILVWLWIRSSDTGFFYFTFFNISTFSQSSLIFEWVQLSVSLIEFNGTVGPWWRYLVFALLRKYVKLHNYGTIQELSKA